MAMVLIYGCCLFDDGLENCFTQYHITIPLNISPADTVYKIGDTIWLSSTIDSLLYDTVSKSMVDFHQYDLRIYPMLDKIDSTAEYGSIQAEHLFDYYTPIGEYKIWQGSNIYGLFIYEQVGSQKVVKTALIPKQMGSYIVKFGFESSDVEDADLPNRGCASVATYPYLVMNGNITDNNYYFLLNNGLKHIKTSTKQILSFENYRMSASFGFKVIE